MLIAMYSSYVWCLMCNVQYENDPKWHSISPSADFCIIIIMHSMYINAAPVNQLFTISRAEANLFCTLSCLLFAACCMHTIYDCMIPFAWASAFALKRHFFFSTLVVHLCNMNMLVVVFVFLFIYPIIGVPLHGSRAITVKAAIDSRLTDCLQVCTVCISIFMVR